MSQTDELLATIEAIHAAGLDATLWPDALAPAARLLGSAAATLEVYAMPEGALRDLHAVGIPPAEQLDYFEHYAAINPRAKYALARPADELLWDYQVLDEGAMDRDPYYMELLPRTDFRYFLSGNLFRTPREMTIVTVQRTRAQGHVSRDDIAMLQRLLPHFRQACDVAQRLNGARRADRALTDTLDWLADGVLLVGADGAVTYANAAAQAICRQGDGIDIARGVLSFAAPPARACFDAAIAQILRVRAGQITDGPHTPDFCAPRPSGAPACVLSVRPCARSGGHHNGDAGAVALVFIRDPLVRNSAGRQALRERFGFTEAEANMASALQAGIGLADYARKQAISLNTAYTHLRRVREKTGCRRMAELIRKLDGIQPPLRPN